MPPDPTSILFRQSISAQRMGRILVNQLEDAELIGELANSADRVDVLHRRRSVVDELIKTLAGRDSATIRGGAFPEAGQHDYDAAFIHIGTGRAFTRGLMTQAFAALRPGGELFCVGANDAGARSAASDLAELAAVEVLGHKGGNRLFRAVRGDVAPVIPESWGTPWETRNMLVEVRGKSYRLRTQPGLFSWEHLDTGTQYLLDALPDLAPRDNAAVLDACCGYGIVGFVAEAEWRPSSITWADDDFLAASCTGEIAGIARAHWMDLTTAAPPLRGGYDLILCNPPFHRSQVTDRSFVNRFAPIAKTALRPRGKLVLVANAFLNYAPALMPHFSSVQTLRANRNYKIIVAGME